MLRSAGWLRACMTRAWPPTELIEDMCEPRRDQLNAAGVERDPWPIMRYLCGTSSCFHRPRMKKEKGWLRSRQRICLSSIYLTANPGRGGRDLSEMWETGHELFTTESHLHFIEAVRSRTGGTRGGTGPQRRPRGLDKKRKHMGCPSYPRIEVVGCSANLDHKTARLTTPSVINSR